MFNIKNTDIVLCAIQRNEDDYIEEWLKHNIEIVKFDKIYIYDDDRLDKIKILDIPYVKELVDREILHIEKCPVKIPQPWCYNDFYNKFNPAWVSFIDCDEFLCLDPFDGIHKFIDNFTNKHPDASIISFPWQNFGDSGHYYKTNEPVQQRFNIPSEEQRWMNGYNQIEKKVIVRGSIKGLSMQNAHHTNQMMNVRCYRSDGFIDKYEKTLKPYTDHPFIKHYATKSTEEFIVRKLDGDVSQGHAVPQYLWIYFVRNAYTDERVNMFKKIYKNLTGKEVSNSWIMDPLKFRK